MRYYAAAVSSGADPFVLVTDGGGAGAFYWFSDALATPDSVHTQNYYSHHKDSNTPIVIDNGKHSLTHTQHHVSISHTLNIM